MKKERLLKENLQQPLRSELNLTPMFDYIKLTSGLKNSPLTLALSYTTKLTLTIFNSRQNQSCVLWSLRLAYIALSVSRKHSFIVWCFTEKEWNSGVDRQSLLVALKRGLKTFRQPVDRPQRNVSCPS